MMTLMLVGALLLFSRDRHWSRLLIAAGIIIGAAICTDPDEEHVGRSGSRRYVAFVVEE